jgi:Ca-activated chloride channel family protein
VLPRIDLDSIVLGDRLYAGLLLVPAALMVLGLIYAAKHFRDSREFKRRRHVPIAERLPHWGDAPFWLGAVVALALTIAAVTRPQAIVDRVRTAGIDLIVLQDGSASMHVRDVAPDRWRRSVRFLRTLAESLRWKDDRIALALFARIAAPQVRLTRDPNTFFFFLDHLARESPFPLDDDTTWDTNIELGVYWGTRLVEKDDELHGRSKNIRAFVLVSDGQAWSGEVQRALQLAQLREIPVFVVGVGTASGGVIPEPPRRPAALTASPLHSALDRASLRAIATAGGGRYFDLDRQSDERLAGTILDDIRRRAGSGGVQPIVQDLYWPLLVAAAGLLCAGVLFVHDRGELLLQTLGAAVALVLVWTIG